MIKYLLLIVLLFCIGCIEPTTYEEKEISVTDQKQMDPEAPAIVPLLKCK